MNVRRLLWVRGLRAFGDGYVSLLLPIYLLSLGLTPFEVGVIATGTLLGSGVLTLLVGLHACRFRYRVLLLGAAALMTLTELGFATFAAFWPLLIVAIAGTLNPSSGDVSVFLPLEHSILARVVGDRQRTAVFARYSLVGALVGALAALFSLDAFGGGFIVQSLLALWLFEKYQLSTAIAGTIFFWTGVFSAFSYLAATRIANRIGLVNTMVFTHLPSSILLLLVPFAPSLASVIALLLVRSALSQMDVPTRSSYVMAVVVPPARAAAASMTSVPRRLASAVSPPIAGYLLGLSSFGWPLIIAGGVKIVYDLLLLANFRSIRPPEEVAIRESAARP